MVRVPGEKKGKGHKKKAAELLTESPVTSSSQDFSKLSFKKKKVERKARLHAAQSDAGEVDTSPV